MRSVLARVTDATAVSNPRYPAAGQHWAAGGGGGGLSPARAPVFYLWASITRNIAGWVRFLTLIQSFDRPAL